MILALDCPTWSELEREPLPVDGPFRVRRGLLGYVWAVIDSRTHGVRATAQTEGEAQDLADRFNRELA